MDTARRPNLVILLSILFTNPPPQKKKKKKKKKKHTNAVFRKNDEYHYNGNGVLFYVRYSSSSLGAADFYHVYKTNFTLTI